MMNEFRTVYYDHSRSPAEQPHFPTGEAGFVRLGHDGEWRADAEVWIGPNSHCALVKHGVAEQLARLPSLSGRIGEGRDALIGPAGSEDAARIFYAADRMTYGARFDFVAVERRLPEPIRYRVAIDNREYQQTLSRLQFLATRAARYGHGLRLRI